MTRYALVYGSLSGAVMLGVILAGITLTPHSGVFASLWFGYLVMLLAFMLIFVGLKRYRDVEKGGVIKFLPALGVAALTALVACIVYVLVWEAYLASTGYQFFDQYAAQHLARMQESGASPAAIAEEAANMEWGRGLYAHWYTRMAITLTEPLPIAILVPFISAALLRNPRFLPAKR